MIKRFFPLLVHRLAVTLIVMGLSSSDIGSISSAFAQAAANDGFSSNTSTLKEARIVSKVAFIIANSNYKMSSRPSTPAEATEIARLLTVSGYSPIILRNPNREELTTAFRASLSKMDGDSDYLFVYLGRAVQHNGKNYLLMTDDDSKSDADIPIRNIDLNLLFGGIERAKMHSAIVIVDAAYSEPYGTTFKPLREGLADIRAPSNTFLAFSTSPGRWASTQGSAPSIFAQQLIRLLGISTFTVEQLFRQVREAVSVATSADQVPWDLTSLRTSITLGRKYDVSVDSGPAINPLQLEAIGQLTSDRLLWDSVNETARRRDFELYLARFPNGVFAALAKRKVIELPQDNASINSKIEEGISLSNGARYKGALSTGVPHGLGEMISPDGSVFIGQFTQGKRSGKGRIIWSSGQIYVGEFREDIPHGFGSMTFSNDDQYTGNFSNGVINGKGRYESATDKSIYFGEFVNGSRLGEGKLILASGDEYEGTFTHGQLNGSGRHSNPAKRLEYKGSFVNSVYMGLGVLIDGENEMTINGSFAAGLANGFAQLKIKSEVYLGNFINGVAQGQGEIVYETGAKYQGNVVRGVPSGLGQFIYPDGGRYEGQLDNAVPHGNGALHFKNGTSHRGTFHNGIAIGQGERKVPDLGTLVGTFEGNDFEGDITRPIGIVERIKIKDGRLTVLKQTE